MHNFSGFVDPTSWKIAVLQDFLAEYSSKSSVQTIFCVRLLHIYFCPLFTYCACTLWCYTGYEASWQAKCVINQFIIYHKFILPLSVTHLLFVFYQVYPAIEETVAICLVSHWLRGYSSSIEYRGYRWCYYIRCEESSSRMDTVAKSVKFYA